MIKVHNPKTGDLLGFYSDQNGAQSDYELYVYGPGLDPKSEYILEAVTLGEAEEGHIDKCHYCGAWNGYYDRKGIPQTSRNEIDGGCLNCGAV